MKINPLKMIINYKSTCQKGPRGFRGERGDSGLKGLRGVKPGSSNGSNINTYELNHVSTPTQSNSYTVTFTTLFNSIPTIFISMNYKVPDDDTIYSIEITNVTTSSFSYLVKTKITNSAYISDGVKSSNLSFYYFALG